MLNLASNTKVTRIENAVAAGSSDENSNSIDMQNFEGVMVIAMLGTLTASQVTTLKAQASDDDGVADGWSDLAGTQTTAMSDNDDDQCVILDIKNPVKRYIRFVVERATANAVIDGLVAIQYGPLKSPTTHDSSTVQSTEVHTSPAEGTA